MMKKPRPSNLVISSLVSIMILLAIFAIGALIYHFFKGARESDEGLGQPEQELLN